MEEWKREILARIAQGTKGVSQADVKSLGIEFTRGWRKKVLAEYGLVDVKKSFKGDPQPMPESGFLYRRTRKGKCHIVVAGQALCRKLPNWGKETVSESMPDGISICQNCLLISNRDPDNRRVTESNRERDSFYGSWEWKKARFEILKRFGAVCMCCGSEEKIVVDHIKPRKKYPSLALDLNNLQVLCNDCNIGKANDDCTDFRPRRYTAAEAVELGIIAEARGKLH